MIKLTKNIAPWLIITLLMFVFIVYHMNSTRTYLQNLNCLNSEIIDAKNVLDNIPQMFSNVLDTDIILDETINTIPDGGIVLMVNKNSCEPCIIHELELLSSLLTSTKLQDIVFILEGNSKRYSHQILQFLEIKKSQLLYVDQFSLNNTDHFSGPYYFKFIKGQAMFFYSPQPELETITEAYLKTLFNIATDD